MSTETHNSSQQLVRIEAIAETHGTALTETTNKYPFINLLIAFFQSILLPKRHFFLYFLVDYCHTILDFWNGELLFFFPSTEMPDIVPTVILISTIASYLPKGSLQ